MLYVIPKREPLEPDAFLHTLQYTEICEYEFTTA